MLDNLYEVRVSISSVAFVLFFQQSRRDRPTFRCVRELGRTETLKARAFSSSNSFRLRSKQPELKRSALPLREANTRRPWFCVRRFGSNQRTLCLCARPWSWLKSLGRHVRVRDVAQVRATNSWYRHK